MKTRLAIIFIILAKLYSIAGTKPNVILFITDDLGFHDLSCNGSQFYETPNIDQLAKSGVQFSSAYVSHPRCVPSRYSIQTGKYPAREQIPGGKEQMKVSEITIGEAFKANGYTTFFAGKWHLGGDESLWPQNQGYDINKGGCSAGAPISYFFPYNVGKKENSGGDSREIIGLEDGVEGEYITDRLTDETVSFIKNNKDKSFLAVLSHYAVHTPLQAKKDKIRKYNDKHKSMKFEGPEYITKDGTTKMWQDNAVYAAMIESVDESLGKLVKTLKEEGLYGNTVIVFTSDHGGLSNRSETNKRELATSNLPLRAGKGHSYEGGTRVPFFVHYPKLITKGSYSEQVTVNTDIFPTLLDISGINLMPKQHLDGISMLQAIKGGEPFERNLFWHSPVGRPTQTGDQNCSAVRAGNFKLIDFYDQDKVELYNLKKDPCEKTNLASTDTEMTKLLQDKLKKWKEEVHAIQKTKKNK